MRAESVYIVSLTCIVTPPVLAAGFVKYKVCVEGLQSCTGLLDTYLSTSALGDTVTLTVCVSAE